MVNISINQLGIDFQAPLDSIQWVVTGYALALAAAVPLAGWLMNKVSGKKLLMIAELAFVLTSVLAGCAWSESSLLVFRVFQGLSAGIIIPLMTTLLVRTAGKESLGRLMAVVGTPMIIGPILGPVVGGVIVEYSSWRWIFFINVVFGAIGLWRVQVALPADKPIDSGARMDWIGILLLAAIAVSSIYGLTGAAVHASFVNARTIVFVGLALAGLVAYVFYDRMRRDATVMPLKMFRVRSFTAASIGLFLAGLATNGPMLLLPLFFQNVRAYSVVLAGLALLPMGVGMLAARPTIGKMIDKIGAKQVVLVSLAISLAGSLPLIWITSATPYWLLALILFVRGIGIGGITMPLMSDAYMGMAPAQVASASVATRMIQNLGGAFGSGVLATVVAMSVRTHVGADVGALTTAYQLGFLVACIVLVLLAIPAFFLTDKATEVRELS
jgi:EmrB/QacA subfamily drug resistance transporter